MTLGTILCLILGLGFGEVLRRHLELSGLTYHDSQYWKIMIPCAIVFGLIASACTPP